MKKIVSYMPPHCKELCKSLNAVSQSKAAYQVFEDWLALSAISISNTVDIMHSDEREKEFTRIMKSYSDEERERICSCLGVLTKTLNEQFATVGYKDVLGDVFHAMNLHDKYKGQFFTPSHICEFMGEINLMDTDTELTDKVGESLYNKGYTSVCEPCIGSGGMVLGFAQAMKNHKLNPQQQLIVTGVDVDIKCVYMSYLQLSLYGIPAVILHGNSLSNEIWSAWYTPMYVVGGWDNKLAADKDNPLKTDNNQSVDLSFPDDESGQLILF